MLFFKGHKKGMGYTLYCCDVRVPLNNPFIFVYKTYPPPPPAPSVLVYFRLPMFRWLVHLENLCSCTLSLLTENQTGHVTGSKVTAVFTYLHIPIIRSKLREQKMCKMILLNEQTNNKLYTSKEYVNAKQIMLSRCGYKNSRCYKSRNRISC